MDNNKEYFDIDAFSMLNFSFFNPNKGLQVFFY